MRNKDPRFIDRTGETKIQNSSGINATIIAYRNNKSIDVEFDTGQIVKNKRYTDFCKGLIRCPVKIEIVDDYAVITNVNTDSETVFTIDIEDIPLVEGKHFRINPKGYVIAGHKPIKLLHRLIMNVPHNAIIDHADMNTLNNCKSNLRICDRSKNGMNRKSPKSNTSGYKGVIFHKNYWNAQISASGKHIYLGNFKHKEAAAYAYNFMAKQLHKEFAQLNTVTNPPSEAIAEFKAWLIKKGYDTQIIESEMERI